MNLTELFILAQQESINDLSKRVDKLTRISRRRSLYTLIVFGAACYGAHSVKKFYEEHKNDFKDFQDDLNSLKVRINNMQKKPVDGSAKEV